MNCPECGCVGVSIEDAPNFFDCINDHLFTDLTLDEMVDNGCRWLDEIVPGWRDRINTRTLDLADPFDCICGQVFNGLSHESGFTYAQSTLMTEALYWMKVYGQFYKFMDHYCGFNAIEAQYSYDDLQAAWVERLSNDGLSGSS